MIEAIQHESKPIVAVQWHPEKLDDMDNKSLILEFAKLV
jgi:gamma-glutamyl-gamma-aminobutyrate hydrolase PuuD